MSPIEITAVLLGLANIVLIIRRSVWNFPFAIAMVTLYGMIFFEAKLYSDAGLQIFFMLVNLYGWWSWRHAKQDQGAIMVRRLGRLAYATCIVATVLAIAGWGYFMGASTDASYPYWDATIAMMSVAGQVLM
ncbi:MAG: nicotinamide riboside transporter PnuC, partial [Sphingorhabdus sp.]